MMKNLKMKGEMKLKVRKRLKMLVALVLIFSILCADSNVSLYANDSQETEAMEESFAGQADAQTVTEDAASEETVSEEVSDEETSTEEADYFEVDLNEAAVADKIQPRLKMNYQDVCMGGGSEINNGNNGKPNWNETGKPSQDPKLEKKYWDYTPPNGKNPYNTFIDEQQLIDEMWPKKGEAANKDRLKDAVLEPEYQCYYGNPLNGYGKHVNYPNDQYVKYNADWTQNISWEGNATPYAGVYSGQRTGYEGNYIYKSRNGWKNPFTIVTRSVIGIADKSEFYINAPTIPAVYDMTSGNAELIVNKSNIMYEFQAIDGKNVSYSGNFPALMGKFELTIQTHGNKEKFRLPGRVTKKVDVLPKGYKIQFKKKFDGNDSTEISDSEWGDGRPTEFDQEVKKKFGKDMYLENKTYEIPIPNYDQSKYIFEGWEVSEEYVTNNYQTALKTIQLSDADNNKKYEYKPTAVGRNAWFVLNSTLTAKFRTRKTDTINVVDRVINGNEVDEAVSVNPTSQTVTEQLTTAQTFSTFIKSGYAYEFVGWSDTQGNNLGTTNTYTPTVDFNTQTEQNKKTTLYATYQPKDYNITFDANGGQHNSNSGLKTTTQNTRYYNTVQLTKNPFVRDGYIFKGWSKTQNSKKVDYADQANVYNLPINGNKTDPNNNFPENTVLYAVWERDVASVSIEKYKDVVVMNGSTINSFVQDFYIDGSTTKYNGAEIIRYYLDVEVDGVTDVSTLKAENFNVVWERKKQNESNFIKQPLDSQSPFLIALESQLSGTKQKVFWDSEKKQWFAPLILKRSNGVSSETVAGEYRVNVAYNDPNATKKVATEQEFYNGTNTYGWTMSAEITIVRVIDNIDKMVSIPATATLHDEKEQQADGSVKEVIKSKDLEVKVKTLAHKVNATEEEDKTGDYDWSTPSTSRDGVTSNDYRGGGHKEYVTQKPYKVTAEWNETLTSESKHSITGVKMYKSGTTSEEIDKNAEFKLDGLPDNKILYSFYLKGDKPSNLPYGTTFKGVITFRFTNI